MLGAPILWYRDERGLISMAALGAIWLGATLLAGHHHLYRVVPTIEAAAVGGVVGVSLETSPAVLLALALPPFLVGLGSGIRGALVALGLELTMAVGLALAMRFDLSPDVGLSIFTWAMAGLGLGLIGSFVHAMAEREPDELTSYLDAQRLIKQLLDLSGDLSSGLDVTALAGTVVSDVRDQLPTSAFGLYLPRGETLIPLVAHGSDSAEVSAPIEIIAVESWARGEPLVDGLHFAFPLGDGAVVAGALSLLADLQLDVVERSILDLTRRLRSKAVQLDTALLFSDFRDLASADVRQRLAREMHDGIAQDIASLGYLVDALAAKPASDKQAQQFTMLRDRITKIVAEVRQSVLTLRTSIGESQSLGAAIGLVARHLSESSGISIQVSLDEQSTRLRPEVEAELFRIAQEAMNNAIKHAQCSTIEVTCRVYAPNAALTVRDNGRGLQAARSDSHGLKIMRERARLAGAELSIVDDPTGGLVVSVAIGALPQDFPHNSNAERVSP
ncbi:sensor histidine kinase [Nocardioides sp.]|uniref:sensor histidine kinase n=1 Tax=Nocardioides sp. TaxID=35761 RepID=UPI00321967F9